MPKKTRDSANRALLQSLIAQNSEKDDKVSICGFIATIIKRDGRKRIRIDPTSNTPVEFLPEPGLRQDGWQEESEIINDDNDRVRVENNIREQAPSGPSAQADPRRPADLPTRPARLERTVSTAARPT